MVCSDPRTGSLAVASLPQNSPHLASGGFLLTTLELVVPGATGCARKQGKRCRPAEGS